MIVVDSTTIGTTSDGRILRFYVGRCSDCQGISAMRDDRPGILRWGADHEARAHPGRDAAARAARRARAADVRQESPGRERPGDPGEEEID